MIPNSAFFNASWSSVNSWSNCPEVVFTDTRSLCASEPKKRVAELRTNVASSIERWTSSKTMDTNRWGKTTAFPAMGSALDEYPVAPGEVTAEAVRVSGVSRLKDEIVCSFRSSNSRKSSFFSPLTTLPLASRTTTRTSTRLTLTLNVVGVSRLDTSWLSLDGGDCTGLPLASVWADVPGADGAVAGV